MHELFISGKQKPESGLQLDCCVIPGESCRHTRTICSTIIHCSSSEILLISLFADAHLGRTLFDLEDTVMSPNPGRQQ